MRHRVEGFTKVKGRNRQNGHYHPATLTLMLTKVMAFTIGKLILIDIIIAKTGKCIPIDQSCKKSHDNISQRNWSKLSTASQCRGGGGGGEGTATCVIFVVCNFSYLEL